MIVNGTTDVTNNEYTGTGHLTELLTTPDITANFYTDGGVGEVNIASYERYNTAQYGGRTRSFRYDNQYIPCYFSPINNLNNLHDVWGGDAVVNLYDFQRSEIVISTDVGFQPSSQTNSDGGKAVLFPAESHNLNPEYRIRQTQLPARRIGEDVIYNERYNIPNRAYYQENNSTLFFSKALNQKDILEQPFSIYVSSPKLDGETVNSWRFFKVNDFISVNGNFGPINKILEFRDKLFFFQNAASGITAVNERVLINEGSTEQTQLGTGGVLSRYDYLTTESGAFHQFAVEKYGGGILYYDAFNNKIIKLTNDATSFSDLKGLRGLLLTLPDRFKTNDRILMPSSVSVHCAFDSQLNKIYFTFKNITEAGDKSRTISIDGLFDFFETTNNKFKPTMYLSLEDGFISSEPSLNNTVYFHNKGNCNDFYGELGPSLIKIRVNPESNFVKTFDGFEFNTEVEQNLLSLQETISTIRMSNDYQNSGLVNLVPGVNITPRLRKWRFNKVRSTNSTYGLRDRMRDKYLDVTLTFNQQNINDNKSFILHDVITEYSMRSTIKPNQDA